MKIYRKTQWIVGAIAAICSATLTLADSSRDDYLAALKIADQHVQKQKARAGQHMHLGSSTESLSSGVVKSIYGRTYKVGDSWDVAASHIPAVAMRMTEEPEMLQAKNARVGVFHYEVTDIGTDAQPTVTLKVTQRQDLGASVIDAKVDALFIKWSDKMKQTQKSYQMQGRAQPVQVSPDGLRSTLTGLELFPLDVPDIITADLGEKPTSFPTLPSTLNQVALNAGFHVDMAKSSFYEQDDFFGRPVQILWQKGDPWPAYIKTAQGIAVLVRKGER